MLLAKGKLENKSVTLHLCGEEKIELACTSFLDVYGKLPLKEKRARSGIGETLLISSDSAFDYVSNIGNIDPLYTAACPQCTSFFMKGIFVSCGRISNPQSSYRLELSVGHLFDAVSVCDLGHNVVLLGEHKLK